MKTVAKAVKASVGMALVIISLGCPNSNVATVSATSKHEEPVPIDSSAPVGLPTVSLVSVGNEMQVPPFGISIVHPQEPILKLRAALKQDRKSRRFRVTWRVVLASLNSSSTVLYDRKRKTLRYHAESWSGKTKERKNYLFTGVTEEILAELSNKETSRPDVGFLDLHHYGITSVEGVNY